MSKLIKISEEHYIIVDDSEIQKDDWVFALDTKTVFQCNKHEAERPIKQFKKLYRKITHSTDININELYYIPLSEVEETIYGCSVEKMAINSFGHKPSKDDTDILLSLGKGYVGGYQQGFKAHQELVKDKLFTVEDMKNAIQFGLDGMYGYKMGKDGHTEIQKSKYIQSLQPTEWEITFDEQGKIKLI